MTIKSCWIIGEDIAGTRGQALAVARALGLSPIVKNTYARFGVVCGDKLEAPWPDLIIAAGRKAVKPALHVKKQSGAFTVFLQNPRKLHKEFDLISAPMHDGLKGDNIISTVGAPNRISEESLKAAKKKFDFSHLKSPRIAVLIGGRSKAYDLSARDMKSISKSLGDVEGSLMITASRRTKSASILKDMGFFYDGQGDNPYLGMLAWADHIIVTCDSVSMLSDAVSTGKPVHIIDLPKRGNASRIERFHKTLINKGFARKLNCYLESRAYKPLNDAQVIANEIKRRMKCQKS